MLLLIAVIVVIALISAVAFLLNNSRTGTHSGTTNSTQLAANAAVSQIGSSVQGVFTSHEGLCTIVAAGYNSMTTAQQFEPPKKFANASLNLFGILSVSTL